MSNKNRSLLRTKVGQPVVRETAQSSAFAKIFFTFGMLLTAAISTSSVYAQTPPDAGSILEGTREVRPPPKPAPEVLEVKPTPLVREEPAAKKATPKAPEVIEAKPVPKAAPKAPEVIEAKPAPKAAPAPTPAAAEAKPAPAPAPAPAPVAKAPGTAVKVSGFKVSGNTVYPEAVLVALIADNIGKELSFEDLSQVPAKISAHYRSKGYFLAQAYLPAQDVKNGVVEIAVLEGRVGEVKLHMAKDARLRESVARGILSAIEPGELIEEADLERSLLLLNDFPSVTVKSTLQPGAKVGEADVVAELTTGALITGTVEIDNWGNRFASENRIGASVNVNNPTGFGDLLTFRALAPIKTGSAPGELNVGRISYLLPVGSYGTKVGVGYSLLDYKLGKDFAALGAEGDGEISSFFALHPIIRTRNFNLFAILGYDVKNLEDRTTTPISVDAKRVDQTKVTLSSDFRDGMLGGGLNTLSLTYSRGEVDLQTPTLKAIDQSPVGRNTDGKFEKINYELQRLQYLKENFALLVSLNGQLASKNLVSAEKFSIGGPTAVRSYPTGEGGGDQGSVISAELRWNVPQIEWLPADVLLTGFIDQGNIQTNRFTLITDIGNKRRLTGYGVGLNVGKPNDYLLRSTVGWHDSNDAPTTDVDRDPRLFVQFTKWF